MGGGNTWQVLSKRRALLLGHVALVDPEVPAYQALHLQVNGTIGRRPDSSWQHLPDRLRKSWIQSNLKGIWKIAQLNRN